MFPQEERKMKRSPIAWIPIAILAAGIIVGIFTIIRERPMKLKN